MSIQAELDPINVSALNQYSYCARRCALIYLENEFADNRHTARGNAEHERVDRIAHATSREGAKIQYALPIWSERLGLVGKCDVVEFWSDGTVYPVEYKHGTRRAWLNDDIQLAAQAMCLEEMFETIIPKAAIFHASSKKRRIVELSEQLRKDVTQTILAIRDMLATGNLPPPTLDIRRCRECSLNEICQPELLREFKSDKNWKIILFNPD